MPLLRKALHESGSNDQSAVGRVILESNTLLQFLKPSLYLMVVDPTKADFKDSARMQMDRASAVILREPAANVTAAWAGASAKPLRGKPQFLQRDGDELPAELRNQVRDMLRDTKGIAI